MLNQKAEEIIYAVDNSENYIKFNNIKQAGKKTKVFPNNILKCLSGDLEYTGGLVFTYASDIEYQNKPDPYMIKICADILKDAQDETNPFLTLSERIEEKEEEEEEKEQITRVCDIPQEDFKNLDIRFQNNPFYIMDRNGNYRKYHDKNLIAEILNTNLKQARRYIKGEIFHDDFAFIDAKEVESKGANGKILVDTEKIKGKFKEEEGIYAINAQGEYARFKTAAEASKKLKISKSGISNCLSGKQEYCGDYIIIKSSEIEIKNPDGTIEIDIKKINEAKKILQNRAIYLINEKGYKRYNNPVEAGKILGINSKLINNCLLGKNKTVQGYAAVYANEVERYNDKSELIVNTIKLKQIYENSQIKEKAEIDEDGFYVINEKGEYRKFYKILTAHKATNISRRQISSCLLDNSLIAKGHICVLASEIESENENGKKEVDLEKLKQKMRIFNKDKFYAIDKYANATCYSNQVKTAEILKVPKQKISACISGKAKTTGNYVFVRPEIIEKENENGEIVLDEDLIRELAKEIYKNELYLVDKYGNYKKFESGTKIKEKLGINLTSISEHLKGNRKTCKGYIILRAPEVETWSKDGVLTVDEDLIKERAKILN